MTRDRILACWDLVGRLAFLVVLCFCAEMLVYVVQMFVALAVGEENFGSTGIIASIWRWLAWAPATIYAAAVLICLPLPRIRRDTRWSAGGHMRVPPIGRGLLLLFGFLLFLSTAGHALSFLPDNAEVPLGPGLVGTFMAGALGLLVLRIILGTLRLLPRSWRMAPEPVPANAMIDLPDQKLAPRRNGE